VGGKTVTLSNLEKVLYPETGFAKAQVIDYFARIAPVLVPHTRGRALTMKRYPNGVNEKFFYEKNSPAHRPEWVATAPIWSEGNQREMLYTLANDTATLIWSANLAALELHTSLSLAKKPDRPTTCVFDLDPGEPATIVECAKVALAIRKYVARFDLEIFAKTSGSKGMQLYIPLNTPVSYEDTKAFSHALAMTMEQEQPGSVVSKMAKALRPGKIFIDWSQNDAHKTTICVYSLRAKAQPTVSTPVRWAEVARCAKGQALSFTAPEVLARVEKSGDLFAPVLTLKQKLPRSLK
jgi:bifunctional non-homologous end joining protein LigD